MTETADAKARAEAAGVPAPPRPRRWILMFVGLAGVSMGLTLLFLGMRSVMEIGGSCASGNTPYIARPCPEGVPGMMLLGIFGGLISLGFYAVNAIGVNLVWLAWPALFLSLGWNFFVYGVDPPNGGGVAWGWLICAVVFGLMGGGPLILGLGMLRDKRVGKAFDAARRLGSRLGPVDAERARHLVRIGLAVQLVAIAVGVFVGIELFESATGTNVGFGFR